MDGCSPGYPTPTAADLRKAAEKRARALVKWELSGGTEESFKLWYDAPLNIRKREEKLAKAILGG
jgi:hypothetical protein